MNYNITILLTIYNRLDFTIKWLDFAEKQKIPFNILISDGGNIPNITNKLNLKNRKLNIVYKKYKYYKNYKNLYEKYLYAIRHVKTKFVIVAEDDDYINTKNFIRSSKFLLKNEEYGSVKGLNCLGEFLFKNSKLLSLSLRNENSFNKDYSLTRSNNEIRVIDYFKKKTVSIFNGLHRTKNLKKVFKILGKKNFFNLYITELIFVIYLVYLGKIKRTQYIDYIKMDNSNLSSSGNFSKFRPFSKVIASSNYSYENNLIFKFLKFKDFKNKKKFKKIYNLFLKNDELIRLKEEKIYNSLGRKIKNFLKKIFITINIFYFLKKIYLNIVAKSKINKKILILNVNLIKAVNKNISFIKDIIKSADCSLVNKN